MGSKSVMLYIWLSGRAPKDEAFRWLTARGAHRANDAITKGRNRPVLQQQVEIEDEDEEEEFKDITMKQASNMGRPQESRCKKAFPQDSPNRGDQSLGSAHLILGRGGREDDLSRNYSHWKSFNMTLVPILI